MKSCPLPPSFLYIFLLLAVAWLLIKPIVAIAATGTANCGGGVTISCNAYRCDCRDNVGCTGYDSNGNVISSQTNACPADEYLMQEDAR